MPTKSRRALAPLARARVIWGGGAAALTAVLILFWSNLSSPAPPVPPTIAHSYAAGDSQFIRVMSSLLGPPMVGGNRVRALLNGDQSFPAHPCGRSDSSPAEAFAVRLEQGVLDTNAEALLVGACGGLETAAPCSIIRECGK
jgi:hypothetical protein